MRTREEQQSDPYPTTVEIHCLNQFLMEDWDEEWDRISEELEEQDIPVPEGYYEIQKQILDLHQDMSVVEILESEEDDDGEMWYTIIDVEEQKIHPGMPRYALMFADKPYSTDIFLDNVFRHDMRVPDSLFPQTWKNRQAAKYQNM
uniref:Uncharacterized protein n=1 Tax=Amphora coffeiformis TaxID=265554 RepID=A0A7S3L846_9STRA|mmetsp:Transcript_24564/g.46726  ORF Transcript_24564/g.46726 Transcript_24564/m.46726 type:complete len:146 (+) Transcript_24564:407-844(+)|eukprot:scaffold15108_cov180-Amphora_coffeaeformis.AAC.73